MVLLSFVARIDCVNCLLIQSTCIEPFTRPSSNTKTNMCKFRINQNNSKKKLMISYARSNKIILKKIRKKEVLNEIELSSLRLL